MASSGDKDDKETLRDEENKDYDEELDFFSAKFNPDRALFSENVFVPFPEIKSFPTVNKYEDAVQKRKQRKPSTQTEPIGKDESTSISAEKIRRSDLKTKHLQRIESPESRHSLIIDSTQQRSHTKSGDITALDSRLKASSLLPHDHKHLSEGSKQRSSSRYEKEPICSNFKKRVPELDLKDSSSKQDQNKAHEKFNPGRDGNRTHSKPDNSKRLSSEPGEGTSHLAARSGKKTKERNVFSRMETISGPISLLKRCVEERLHVRVKTRAAVSVRSICRGYIVAFDKYFNMAMIDVDEIYKRPPALGKVRARRTHKLIAARKTLLKEKEESQARWRSSQESQNKDISLTSASLQALNIIPTVDELNKILTNVTNAKEIQCSGESLTTESKDGETPGTSLPSDTSNKKTTQVSEKEKLLEKQLRRIQSVYEGLKAPLSPFEREALMLGVPDENICIRHVNQLFIRGENVVSVSIIEDL